jgi:hypothetical protein
LFVLVDIGFQVAAMLVSTDSSLLICIHSANTSFNIRCITLWAGSVNPETGKIIPTPDLASLQSFTLSPEPSDRK